MTSIGTPSNAEVLLHYYCTPVPHPREDAPAVKEALDWFIQIGALEKAASCSSGYKTTPLGEAWVNAICNTKLPRRMFVDEHGNVL